MGEFLPCQPDVHYSTEPPFHGNAEERRHYVEMLNAIADGQVSWREALVQRSWERPVDVAIALSQKRAMSFDMVNIPNDGALPQLPAGRVVEVPARSADGKLAGQPVPKLPEATAAICRAVSDVIDLTADAAALGDRERVHQIVEIDPAIANKKPAHAAADELLKAHADLLTQFE
jgi:alpha-galactosidase